MSAWHAGYMKVLLGLIYIAMALLLLVGAMIRLVLMLSAGVTPDPLPFVSAALAILALLALLPVFDHVFVDRD